MAVETSVDRQTGIVRTRVQGDVDGRELRNHVQSLFERDDLPDPFRELYDSRGVGRFTLSPDGVRAIVEMVAKRSRFDGARFAVVADRDLVYGMARLTSLLSEGLGSKFDFKAFRDIEAAESWLLPSE